MFGFQKPSGQDLLLLGAGVLGGEDIPSGFSRGFGLVAGSRAQKQKSGGRKILKDAQGFQRYADTGERVFPNVQKNDAAKDPNMVSLYKYAVQNDGYTGKFTDFMQMNKGGTTINNAFNPGGDNPLPQYNKLPAGFVYVRDPDTGQIVISEEGVPKAAAVPGTPEHTKLLEADQKRALAQQQGQRNSGIVREMGTDAINLIKKGGVRLPVTGLGAELASRWGGSESADMKNILSTLKAKAAFGSLQELRNASPTGGALGAVSEKELLLLQNAYGSLEQSQSADQLARNIQRFVKLHEDIVNYGINPDGSRRTGNSQGSNVQQNTPSLTPQEIANGGISKKYKMKWEIIQ